MIQGQRSGPDVRVMGCATQPDNGRGPERDLTLYSPDGQESTILTPHRVQFRSPHLRKFEDNGWVDTPQVVSLLGTLGTLSASTGLCPDCFHRINLEGQ